METTDGIRGYAVLPRGARPPGGLHPSGAAKSVLVRPNGAAEYTLVYFDEAHDGPRHTWPEYAKEGELWLFNEKGPFTTE